MTIGERIRNIRKLNGITQKQLADACGIDDATVRKYESGKLNPKADTLKKIARGLGVNEIVLTDSSLNTPEAMIRLFDVFNAYSGKLKDGKTIRKEIEKKQFDDDDIYISFESLNAFMASWYNEYTVFMNQMRKAEAEKDEKKKEQIIEEANSKFQMWMYKYPETEPQKDMLEFNRIMDEAGDYMGTHPLTDLENPASNKEKTKSEEKVKTIYKKTKK